VYEHGFVPGWSAFHRSSGYLHFAELLPGLKSSNAKCSHCDPWGAQRYCGLVRRGFLSSYMKKKGENLATHEVEQVRAVTTTTKNIEAKISSEVWDRQKRWELKRDVLFEVARRLSELNDALLAYASSLRTEKTHEQSWNETFLERSKRWLAASTAFDEAELLVAIVCNKETKGALDDFDLTASTVTAGIGKQDAGIYDKSRADLARKLLAVRVAIRKELEIDRPAELLSRLKNS
jgi:hypothetical protein